MDAKNQPPKPSTAPEGAVEVTKSIRHRFVEGETTVMPLADILRAKQSEPPAGAPSAPAGQAHSGQGDRTSVAHNPLAASRQPQANPSGLTPAQEALFSRTEPMATQVARRPEGLSRQAASREVTARRALAEIHRETIKDVVPTVPNVPMPERTVPAIAKPAPPAASRSPSAVEVAMAESLAEVGAAPAPGRAPLSSGSVAAPQAKSSRRRVANGIIVMFACKGGAGATMLSINVSYKAAKDGQSACLVDTDFQMGDVLASLGLAPRYNIAQATTALAENGPFSKNLLPVHASGVSVLSQVGALDDLDKITPDAMAQLVQTARQGFDVVVVDGVRDFSDHVLAILDVADKITLVTVQEVLAIRRARWAFSILRKIGFDPQDITIVINRYAPSGDISLGSVQSMFEPALVLTVPTDSAQVTQSLNRGVPLLDNKAQTSVGLGVMQVCANTIYDEIPVDPKAVAEESAAPKSVWNKLFGRTGAAP